MTPPVTKLATPPPSTSKESASRSPSPTEPAVSSSSKEPTPPPPLQPAPVETTVEPKPSCSKDQTPPPSSAESTPSVSEMASASPQRMRKIPPAINPERALQRALERERYGLFLPKLPYGKDRHAHKRPLPAIPDDLTNKQEEKDRPTKTIVFGSASAPKNTRRK